MFNLCVEKIIPGVFKEQILKDSDMAPFSETKTVNWHKELP